MMIAVVAFAAGIAWLQTLPALPTSATLAVLAALGGALALVPLASSRPAARAAAALGALLLGVSWAGLRAQLRLADALPASSEGRDVQVVGVVAGLPQRFENGVRFDFDIERASTAAPRHVSLAWYHEGQRAWHGEDEAQAPVQPVHAGERWQLTVRLRRPHGNLNPHGYDYEAALLERGVRATGYVRAGDGNRRQDEFVWRAAYAVERLRERVRERFDRVLADAPYAGVLVALAVGDQRAIDPGS